MPGFYRGNDWLISKADAPHVAREAWTVQFKPTIVADVAEQLDRSRRLSASATTTTRCSVARTKLRLRSDSVRREPSQPYYVDITHKDANKGAVIEFLSRHLEVPAAEIATIGDQPTTCSLTDRGIAHAMRSLIA